MASELTKDQHTIAEHHFKTEDNEYTLYVQEWGNPDANPILYLHGGPGAGCSDRNKRIFDPEKHRVIFLDQRGAGKSTPYASLKSNTTPKLVQDIELVRQKLRIDSWHIIGRSWGSTLALCYAIEYTQSVESLVIGGVFLGSQEEIDWVEKGGFRLFYPEVEFDSSEKLTPLKYTNLFLPAAQLDDRFAYISEEDFDAEWLGIELEYMKNRCYLPEGYLLAEAQKITPPVYIIQGRYDMITPPKYAYALHKALPNSTLQWVVAGHSGSDRAVFDATKAVLNLL